MVRIVSVSEETNFSSCILIFFEKNKKIFLGTKVTLAYL